MNAAEAIASVPELDIKTPDRQIADALADGLVLTTSMEDGYPVASAENGIDQLSATVVGRKGENPITVLLAAVEQHRENVARLVNGEPK